MKLRESATREVLIHPLLKKAGWNLKSRCVNEGHRIA